MRTIASSVLLAVGCASAEDSPCQMPLTDYCDGPCATFDESVSAAQEGTGRQMVHVYVKECGANHTLIHYIDIHNLYGVIEWFDQSGTLVGASAADDDIDDCGYAGTEWGEVPACEPGCIIESIPYCGEQGDECTPADYVNLHDCGGGVPSN